MSSDDSAARDAPSGPRGPHEVVPIAAAVLGCGLIGAGIAATFTAAGDTGSAALLIVGALALLYAVLGDRFESLRYGQLELVLRRKADEAAGRGDLEAAETLQRAADTVGQRVARTARSYRDVRGTMPAGADRTAMMEQVISAARRDAVDPDLDADEVLSRLWTGSEGTRVWALGTLQARPDLATTRAVLEAVQRPDQMFDQYQALRLAEAFVALPDTRQWAKERIAAAVRAQLESGALGTDHDSLTAARRLLEDLRPAP